uniref:Uncharacterized protein n=1 Tax=Kalanchoe fedtschenkoi TaxID=63787 RepID=A0A7N0VAZ1_KALFE
MESLDNEDQSCLETVLGGEENKGIPNHVAAQVFDAISMACRRMTWLRTVPVVRGKTSNNLDLSISTFRGYLGTHVLASESY